MEAFKIPVRKHLLWNSLSTFNGLITNQMILHFYKKKNRYVIHPSSCVDRTHNRFRRLIGKVSETKTWVFPKRNEWWVCLFISRKTRSIPSIRLHRDVCKIFAPEILYYRSLIITTRSKQTILFKAVDCPVELQVYNCVFEIKTVWFFRCQSITVGVITPSTILLSNLSSFLQKNKVF